MKICNVCLANNFLCSGCTKKLERKEITNIDIEVSRAIHKLGLEADFSRSYEDDGFVAVFANKMHSGILIGRAGRNVKRLSLMLEKDVRIVETTDDERKMVERVLNVPVLGINKVYSKNETYRVKVQRLYRNRVTGMDSLLKKIVGKNVEFIFE